MSWKKVLIERLINQKYDFDNTTGEFSFAGKDHVFDTGLDHQKWYYSQSPFQKEGLKEFDEDDKPAGATSHRKAIENTVNGHSGAPVGGDARKIEHIVGDCRKAKGLFGNDADSEDQHDVFFAVRAKIRHVYEEGEAVGTGSGAGQAMCVLGDDVLFDLIVRHILTEFVGTGTVPNKPVTRKLFEDMIAKLDLFDKMTDDTELNVTKDEFAFNYEKAKRGSKGQDHTSW